jgi:hypothetical protein
MRPGHRDRRVSRRAAAAAAGQGRAGARWQARDGAVPGPGPTLTGRPGNADRSDRSGHGDGHPWCTTVTAAAEAGSGHRRHFDPNDG